MADPTDLENIIEDSVNDSVEVDTPAVDAPDTTEDDLRGHGEEVVEENQIETPATKIATEAAVDDKVPVEDEFAKKFGIQANSVTGRENRIPYSRVKKIVEKNEKDAIARVTKELETKYATFGEFETKVKDYEGRLERVAQFEQILENDPKQFLGMLSQHPVYSQWFSEVEKLFSGAPQQAQQEQKPDPLADMPQPDQADGMYSMPQLQKLLAWNADQARKTTLQEVEQRYKPIEQAWKSQEQIAQIVPVVEKQIAEARTWDKFDVLEDKIVGLLKADKNLSLERAYMRAHQEYMQAEVLPKLTTDRAAIRQEIIAEMRKKPTSVTAPTGQSRPSNPDFQSGPRSLEDIIAAEIAKSGMK